VAVERALSIRGSRDCVKERQISVTVVKVLFCPWIVREEVCMRHLGNVPWFLVAAVLSFPGCDSGSSSTTWTIFVYGHADHNLSPSLVADIAKMNNATLSGSLQVIVYADWNAALGPQYPTGAYWKQIQGGGLAPIELSSEGEKNFDDPAVLSAAIAKAFTEYPAQRYGLILWDHGGQWWGGYGGDTQDGTVEYPSGYVLSTLATAVRKGLDGAGLTGSRPLDFLAFDTCLLGGAEPAYVLRDISRIYIANAELDFGAGWNYQDTFTYLARNPDTSLSDFATRENECWNALHETLGPDDLLLRSHIAVDTSLLEDLANDTASLVDLIQSTDGAAVRVASAAYGCHPVYYQNADGSVDALAIKDFGQFLDSLAEDTFVPDIASQATVVRQSLTHLTLASTQGAMRLFHQGAFNIALPPIDMISGKVFDTYSAKAGPWRADAKWGELLQLLSDGMSHTEPEVTVALLSSIPAAKIGVTSAQADIGNVVVSLCKEDGADTYVGYGLVSAGRLTPSVKAEITLTNEKALMTIGDAPGQPVRIRPYVLWSDQDPGQRPGLLALIGRVGTDGSMVDWPYASLVISDDDTVATLIQTTSLGSISQYLEGHAGTKFAPVSLRAVVSGTSIVVTEVMGTPIPLTADGVPVQRTNAGTGNYLLLVEVEDVWGNSTVTGATFTY
jgi:hypothetical protein